MKTNSESLQYNQSQEVIETTDDHTLNLVEEKNPSSGEVSSGSTTGTLNHQEEKTSAGARNMIVGALWCIGGIIVTAVTYDAVKDTGGTYFVAWGAILFGALQFFKGVFQALTD
ncbi:MAG: hypothetical protein WCL00_13160 [Bacteroidota bacterium]